MCELEWNRALLMMALISDADISMPAFELQEDSFSIPHDISQQKHCEVFSSLVGILIKI